MAKFGLWILSVSNGIPNGNKLYNNYMLLNKITEFKIDFQSDSDNFPF